VRPRPKCLRSLGTLFQGRLRASTSTVKVLEARWPDSSWRLPSKVDRGAREHIELVGRRAPGRGPRYKGYQIQGKRHSHDTDTVYGFLSYRMNSCERGDSGARNIPRGPTKGETGHVGFGDFRFVSGRDRISWIDRVDDGRCDRRSLESSRVTPGCGIMGRIAIFNCYIVNP
jgi:hypothetical protein